MEMNSPSKIKIPGWTFAILISIAAAAIWKSHCEFSKARNIHSHILEEIVARGIRPYTGDSEQNFRTGKRPRTNLEAEANRIAAEGIANAAQASHSGGGPVEDTATKKRELAFMVRLSVLTADQFEIVLTKIQTEGKLDTDARYHLNFLVIGAFAEQHPLAALTRFELEPDFLANDGSGDFFIPLVLTHLAQSHPHEALDWYKRNKLNFESATGYKSRSNLITAISRTDPQLAFELIPKLDLASYDPRANGVISHPVKKLFLATSTAQDRIATLSAFRSYLASLQGNARKEAWMAAKSGWSEIAERDGFDADIDWPKDDQEGAAALGKEHGIDN